jgi:hypothetical protein
MHSLIAFGVGLGWASVILWDWSVNRKRRLFLWLAFLSIGLLLLFALSFGEPTDLPPVFAYVLMMFASGVVILTYLSREAYLPHIDGPAFAYMVLLACLSIEGTLYGQFFHTFLAAFPIVVVGTLFFSRGNYNYSDRMKGIVAIISIVLSLLTWVSLGYDQAHEFFSDLGGTSIQSSFMFGYIAFIIVTLATPLLMLIPIQGERQTPQELREFLRKDFSVLASRCDLGTNSSPRWVIMAVLSAGGAASIIGAIHMPPEDFLGVCIVVGGTLLALAGDDRKKSGWGSGWGHTSSK